MRNLPPARIRRKRRQVFASNELEKVFYAPICVGWAENPSQKLQEDSFCVISRHDKTLKFDRLGHIDAVGISRLKVAYLGDSVLSSNPRFDVDSRGISDDPPVSP